MMFAYELQNKIAAANKNVQVFVCHPGAANTSLIGDNVNFATRFTWSLIVKMGLAQSAEQGAYPEVMCATEHNLKQRAYYGPSGRWNWSGPVGTCKLEPFALEQRLLSKLWAVTEQHTAFKWTI